MATRRFGKIRVLSSGRFQASYVAPSGQRTFAPETYAKESDARRWLAVQEADVARGTWRPAKRQTPLLGDYAATWLSQREDLRPRTLDLYQRLLRLHIEPTIGGHNLDQLTPAIIRDWHSKLGKTTGATARAQSYRLLRTIMNQANRDGEITANPCQVPGAGTAHHAERVPPTLEQIAQVAQAMPPRYTALVLVAAYGGLRRGELCALTRGDISLGDTTMPTVVTVNKAMVRVGGRWLIGQPKTTAGNRVVTLPRFLNPILTEHLATFVAAPEDALVFGTATGRPLAGSNLSATLRRAQDRAEAPPFPFHTLRHAAATLAIQSGATIKDVMGRIGHASPRAALIYEHTAVTRDQLIAEALDEAAAAAMAGNVIPLRKRVG